MVQDITEGSSATDFVTDLTDVTEVSQKEEGRKRACNSVILSEAKNLTDVSLYCGKFSMTDNSCVSAEKPEIQQDETATDLTQLVENSEKSHNQLGSGSPIGNSQDACATINETACGADILPAPGCSQ